MLNVSILVGNLGADAELKYTASGNPYANFSIATSESWKDTEGQKHQKTTWHRCTIFGKRAEGIAPYLLKGTAIAVVGSTQTSVVEGDDGSKKYYTSIRADKIAFVGRKDSGGSGEAQPDAAGGDEEVPW